MVHSSFAGNRADVSYFQVVLTYPLSSLSLPIDALLCRGIECTEHANSLDNYYTNVISCLQYATKVCVPKGKGGIRKTLVDTGLRTPKKQCFDVTDLWLFAGCFRSGELNIIELELN